MHRKIVVGVAASLVAAFASAASADSQMTVTRTVPGEGRDSSTADGHWTFTVTDMTGKPAQLVVRVHVSDDSVIYASGKPRLGETLTTYDTIPPGEYRVSAIIRGGPPKDDASVTISIATPDADLQETQTDAEHHGPFLSLWEIGAHVTAGGLPAPMEGAVSFFHARPSQDGGMLCASEELIKLSETESEAICRLMDPVDVAEVLQNGFFAEYSGDGSTYAPSGGYEEGVVAGP